MDTWKLLDQSAEVVATRLLGCHLVRELDGEHLVGRIVEVEAYNQFDAASHSYRGKTPRTEVMFGSSGRLYVYFTYGMHYCCNIVTGRVGEASAILIRAIEPLAGEAVMSDHRRGLDGIMLTNGPAKLCQALGIDKQLNGHNLHNAPLQLVWQLPIAEHEIIQTTRIGISQNRDVPWRFYLKDNPYVSKV